MSRLTGRRPSRWPLALAALLALAVALVLLYLFWLRPGAPGL